MDIIPARYPVRTRAQSRSFGQHNLGRQLQNIYGTAAVILEEFPVPNERLFLDFYMPHHQLAFEFQGTQHDKFNKFFHGDSKGFKQSRERDSRKRAWCELNEIDLIEVRDDAISAQEVQTLIQAAREDNE